MPSPSRRSRGEGWIEAGHGRSVTSRLRRALLRDDAHPARLGPSRSGDAEGAEGPYDRLRRVATTAGMTHRSGGRPLRPGPAQDIAHYGRIRRGQVDLGRPARPCPAHRPDGASAVARRRPGGGSSSPSSPSPVSTSPTRKRPTRASTSSAAIRRPRSGTSLPIRA